MKYIFTSDYQANPYSIFFASTAPVAIFNKGDIYSLKPMFGQYMFSYKLPNSANNAIANYLIPGNVVKEYNIKNQPIKNDTMASSYVASKPYIGSKQSSYLGESVISQEKEENLKNAFAVIGILFFALIIYWYIAGGPFKEM